MASQPHFFKFILADSLLNQKLSIPRNFVRKHGEVFSNQVLLKLPNGAKWKVELTKSNNIFWLDSGWQKFADDCFLDEGHLLVFRYDGDSCFYVLIFDPSASEIEYTYNDAHRDEPGIIRNFQHDEAPEILDDFPPFPKRMENTPPSPRPFKKIRKKNSTEEEDFASTEGRRGTSSPHSDPNDFSSTEGRGGTTSPHSYPKCEVAIGRRMIYAGQKTRALERANAFKTEKGAAIEPEPNVTMNSEVDQTKEGYGGGSSDGAFSSGNPFFKLIMKPSYVDGRCKLNVPSSFARSYLNVYDVNHLDVVLQTSDERTWFVKFIVTRRNMNPRVEIGDGWRKFVRGNNLKAGDICVFEFIKRVETSFNVVIYRVSDNANCSHHCQGHQNGSSNEVQPKGNSKHEDKLDVKEVIERPSSSRPLSRNSFKISSLPYMLEHSCMQLNKCKFFMK